MRLFFAIELPEQLRADLYRATNPTRLKYPRQKWSRPDGLHITLKFLGECPPPLTDAVIQAITPDLQNLPILTISGDGYGFFPNKHKPRVFYARIHSTEALRECVALLNNRLEALGFVPAPRDYRPHITLLRIREATPELIHDMGHLHLPEIYFTPLRISLMHSVLKPNGACYLRLHGFKQQSL